MDYRVFHSSKIGERHLQKDPIIPCEDYSSSFKNEKVAIVAVADGHGDPNCFRSRFGSQFAVESAMDSLGEFCDNITADDLFDQKKQQGVFQQLVDSILGKWYMKIDEQLSEMPFSDEEMQGVADKYKERFNRGERLETAYGSTLLCVALTEAYCFGLQIGDGSIVMVSYQNAEMSQPMPTDEECFSNITTSICDKDASSKFRHFVSRDLPLAFFVGSDGIDDSFDGVEELLSKYRGVLSLFGEYGFEKSIEEIEDYLPNLSKRGSGDDVSMAGIVDMETIALYPELLKLQVRDFSLERKDAKLCEDGKNTKSMYERFRAKLKEDIEEAKRLEVDLGKKQRLNAQEQTAISKIMADLTNSQKKKDRLNAEITSMIQELSGLQESNKKQEDRLKELGERWSEAKREHTEVTAERKEVIEQLSVLSRAIASKTIGKGEYILTGESPAESYEPNKPVTPPRVEVFIFDADDIFYQELEIPETKLDEIATEADSVPNNAIAPLDDNVLADSDRESESLLFEEVDQQEHSPSNDTYLNQDQCEVVSDVVPEAGTIQDELISGEVSGELGASDVFDKSDEQPSQSVVPVISEIVNVQSQASSQGLKNGETDPDVQSDTRCGTTFSVECAEQTGEVQ